MGLLQGKCALITGAASIAGIGFATTRRFAAEGCRLAIVDSDVDAIRARARELISAGCNSADAFQLDVTSEEEWIELAEKLDNVWGGLDILVNNAGVIRLSHVEAIDTNDWRLMMDVNLTGTYLGVKHLARLIRSRGGGAIVNLSSVGGLKATPDCAAYAASKGGIRSFTKCAALDLAADRIRVNSVLPGFIQTDMQDQVRESYEHSAYDEAVKSIPLARAGTADDVASAILFLASDDASYITGSELIVDGGLAAT